MSVVTLGFSLAIQPAYMWRGNLRGYDGLPSLLQFVIHAIVFVFFAEVGFYYTHRYCVIVFFIQQLEIVCTCIVARL